MVINVVKKPIEVQAVQWDGTRDGFKEIQEFAGPVVKYMDLGFSHVIAVHTLEGTTVLRKGDFLVKGIKGEFGLGLSIVKKTLNLIGYDILIKNQKKGVSFIISKETHK